MVETWELTDHTLGTLYVKQNDFTYTAVKV